MVVEQQLTARRKLEIMLAAVVLALLLAPMWGVADDFDDIFREDWLLRWGGWRDLLAISTVHYGVLRLVHWVLRRKDR